MAMVTYTLENLPPESKEAWDRGAAIIKDEDVDC